MDDRTTVAEDTGARNKQVAKAIALIGFGKYAGQIIRWSSTFFVARILSPADYGLVGMTELFAGIVFLLAEFGVGTAVLKMRLTDRTELARMNGLSLCSGFTAYAIAAALAPFIAEFFKREELRSIILVSSIAFIFTAMQAVPSAVLQRDLRFRDSATIEFTGHVTTALLVLAGALLGLGYWALVLPALLVHFAKTIWVTRITKVGLALPRLAQIRQTAGYSAWVFSGRLGSYFLYTSDFIIVGRVLGEVALGSYQFAWSLANLPNDQVNGLVARVSGSFYSAVQTDRKEVARLYQLLLSSVSLLSMPMVIGLAVVAEDFVTVVLGNQWSNAIVPLQILCVFNALRIISILASPLLQMMGEARSQSFIELIGLSYLPAIFFFAARTYGPEGVAFAWLVGFPPLLFLILARVRSKIGISFAMVLKAVAPAAVSSALMAGGVLAVKFAALTNANPHIRLASLVSVGAFVYAASIFLLFRSSAEKILGLIRSSRRGATQ